MDAKKEWSAALVRTLQRVGEGAMGFAWICDRMSKTCKRLHNILITIAIVLIFIGTMGDGVNAAVESINNMSLTRLAGTWLPFTKFVAGIASIVAIIAMQLLKLELKSVNYQQFASKFTEVHFNIRTQLELDETSRTTSVNDFVTSIIAKFNITLELMPSISDKVKHQYREHCVKSGLEYLADIIGNIRKISVNSSGEIVDDKAEKTRKLRQAKSQDDLKASKSHSLLADIKPITVSSDDLQQHTLRQKSVDAEKRRLDIALSAFKDKSKERERDDVV